MSNEAGSAVVPKCVLVGVVVNASNNSRMRMQSPLYPGQQCIFDKSKMCKWGFSVSLLAFVVQDFEVFLNQPRT